MNKKSNSRTKNTKKRTKTKKEYTDIKNILLKHKKTFIAIGAVLFLIILFLCLFGKSNSPVNVFKGKPLDIEYKKDKVIKLSNLKPGTVYQNTITVINSSNNNKKYSINWTKVSNTFKEQNKLLYKLDTMNSEALYIGDSQMPVADFTLSKEVTIRKDSTHEYTLYIFFKGNSNKEKKSTFNGILEIKEVD